ncbi:MAG: hypothetical protein K0Q72_723 [Armatimonadetes bacterium]|nr:hypothetical protein [Armatimonadota bacterium]
MVIAQALVLALTVIVAATQLQVVSQYKLSRSEKDNEHALQAAEAGANWYVNRLNNGVELGSAITDRTVRAFRIAVKNGTVAVTRYPAGTEQGYYVGYTSTAGSLVNIAAYGWSRGVVRKIKLQTNQSGGLSYAILMDGPLVVSGNPTINSSVHSNDDLTFWGNPIINGDVTAGDTVTYGGNPAVSGTTTQSAPTVALPSVNAATLRALALANGSRAGLTISTNGAVTLQGVYTGNLIINSNPTITLIGTVYVDGYLQFNGNTTTNLGSGLLVGEDGIQFNGNGSVNGGDGLALLSLRAGAFNSSPPAIEINGNPPIRGVLYAPNGFVRINGNPNITGSIVADSTQINGNPTITRNTNYVAPSALGTSGYDLVGWREIE